MNNEPNILDYLQSLFRKGEKIDLKKYFHDQQQSMVSHQPKKKIKVKKNLSIKPISSHWLLLIGTVVALVAQFQLEPPRKSIPIAISTYLLSGVLIYFGFKNQKYEIHEESESESKSFTEIRMKKTPLIISLLFLIIAFEFFKGNQFTILNLFFWILGCGIFLASIWQDEKRKYIKNRKNSIILVLSAIVFLVSIFFRFYLLKEIPGEMFSDQAEKLLDIIDVLEGNTPIFFIRNTGREPLQFYLTAAIIRIFQTGISFISLKIGTVAAGVVTLFFIYKLGEEVFNRLVGLGAAFFAGIAYWPNVISRVGLRFPFYPLFVAPVLYYVMKGLRERRFNHLILAGLFLGLGLHGYSPIRILPVLVVGIFVFFLISNRTRDDRSFAVKGLVLLAITSLIIFLPLIRYSIENPQDFNYRAFSRLTSIENPISDPIIVVFLRNLWKSITMFFFENGVIWVTSIPNRPALDIVSAVFFFLGLIQITLRIFRNKGNWREFSILASIPTLMLPSILALAYPNENPSLNRSSGAIVPVFIICSLGFVSFVVEFWSAARKRLDKTVLLLYSSFCVLAAMIFNFDLVFNQYADQFIRNAWNTSEIGEQIEKFEEQGNNPDNAFVVPYPHWVDTRLVGINAGYPKKDYALWADDLDKTLGLVGEKLFIVKPEDRTSLDKIKSFYPEAEEEIFYSRIPGKDFIKVYVR